MEIIIVCFAFISTLFLGLITYRNNPKSSSNQLLGLIALDVSLWMIANYLSLIGRDADFTLFWIRIVMLITTPLGPLIYLFLRSFPSLQIKISENLLAFIIGSIFIVCLISLSPFTFTGINLSNGIQPQVGPGILFFGIYSLFFLIAGIRNIYRKYQKSTGLIRLQMKYLFVGFFLTFSLMFISNFILVVIFKISNMVVYGPVFILILLGFITYSIIKHRLLDIRFVLARTVSYSLLSLIIVIFYVTTIYFIGGIIIPVSFGNSQIIISVLLSLIVAYSLQPLRKILEKITDKYFFQDLYDPETLYRSISKILATTIDLDELTNKIFKELSTTISLDRVSLLLENDNSSPYKEIILPQNQLLIVFDDLPENDLKTIMRENLTSVLVKLETKEKKIGLLILGNKLSGDIFNRNDLGVLETIGPQLAIAIQNSQQYEEIKSFSKKLKLEVKKATVDLEQANVKLTELDVLKDEFVSIASHELRTPMTAIKSYLWMALDGQGGPLNPKQKFYLKRSYDSTDRLIKLVNNMLNISRIESGRLSLELAKTNISTLIKEVLYEVSPRAKELGINIIFKPVNTLPSVIADADKIKEVVINIIGNSFKFTPKDGTITINFQVNDDKIITNIIDTGAGLTSEMIKNLFQKFGLIKGSYQTNQISSAQGTGLGLYICKQILKLHNGDISVSSKGINNGSTFSFSLPIFTPEKLKLCQKQFQHTSNVGIIRNQI